MAIKFVNPIEHNFFLYIILVYFLIFSFHHAIQDSVSRRKSLNFQYKFNCICEACVDDWPTYRNLKPAPLTLNLMKTISKLLHPNNIERLQKGDLNLALKLFKPVSILLKLLDEYAPSLELADAQETFKQCVVILQGLLPYEFSLQLDWSVRPVTK